MDVKFVLKRVVPIVRVFNFSTMLLRQGCVLTRACLTVESLFEMGENMLTHSHLDGRVVLTCCGIVQLMFLS